MTAAIPAPTLTTPGRANIGSSPPPPVVLARQLTKVFKDFWGRDKARAVDGVDFDIQPGEVFGLLGPNGSGKSTTIKLILGLLRPTRGHVEVFGQPPDHVPTKDRIGYLPEESCLYRHFTPTEALEFYGKLHDLSASDRRSRTDQLLEMVGLAGARRRTVGEFSKGMQRRLGIAQALINDPDFVILDEPTAGLDPIGCREIKDLVLTLARRGKTVLLSSHLLADVEDVCHRVMIYYGGRIQAHGALRELLATPGTLRLTLPAMPRESLQRLLTFVREELQTPTASVDIPTCTLERYFLGVVERARAASLSTAGATASTAVAPYLQGHAPLTPSAPVDNILERLVDDTTESAPRPSSTPPASPLEASESRSALEAESRINAALSSLVKPEDQP